MPVDYFLCTEQGCNWGCSRTSYPFQSATSTHSLLLLLPVYLLMCKNMKGREANKVNQYLSVTLILFVLYFSQESPGKQAQKLFLQFLMKEMEEINWNRVRAMTWKIKPEKIFLFLMKAEGVLEEVKWLMPAQWSEHHDKRHPEMKGQGEEQWRSVAFRMHGPENSDLHSTEHSASGTQVWKDAKDHTKGISRPGIRRENYELWQHEKKNIFLPRSLKLLQNIITVLTVKIYHIFLTSNSDH